MGERANYIPVPTKSVHAENLPQDYFLMHGIGTDEVQAGIFTIPTESMERVVCGADVDDYDVIQSELEMQRHEAAIQAQAAIARKRRETTEWQTVRL